MSVRKNQRIPDTIWKKLQLIKEQRPWWPMTTVINECLEIGSNWYIKGMAKKKQKENSGDQPEPHERTENNIPRKDPATEEAIKIARTKTYDFGN